MTFSEFLQLLYPYLSDDMSKADFVIFLTAQIMEESFVNNELNSKHPLSNKESDTLMRIFKGTRPLAKKDAHIILSHLDKARFQGYLSKLSFDALDEAMKEYISNSNADVGIIDICTDLFVSILENRVKETRKSTKSKRPLFKSNNPVELFEQAIVQYNIADYILNLGDYLIDETFCAGNIPAFIDYINELSSKFENIKDENVYKNILSFTQELNTYSSCFEAFPKSLSEHYSYMWRAHKNYDEVFDSISLDKLTLSERKNEIISTAETNTEFLSTLEETITQLSFIETIFSSHKMLYYLFEEICDLQTPSIFQYYSCGENLADPFEYILSKYQNT